MKIAAVSEDGATISQHFGRAPFYVVLTIEDSKIIAREQRDKMGHAQFAGEHEEHSHEADPRGHGFDATAQSRHARMAAAIADCDVLLGARHTCTCAALRRKCRCGSGRIRKHAARPASVPIVTDVAGIDEAVQAYLAGALAGSRREAALTCGQVPGIQAGQCACDLRNRQGSCCLGNVRALKR